jgi:hypothetical protein
MFLQEQELLDLNKDLRKQVMQWPPNISVYTYVRTLMLSCLHAYVS